MNRLEIRVDGEWCTIAEGTLKEMEAELAHQQAMDEEVEEYRIVEL